MLVATVLQNSFMFAFHGIRGSLNRYTKKTLQDSANIFSTPGMGKSAFYCANHRVANVSNPQGGKSTDFSAGKCHLLYFVVVPESPRDIAHLSRDMLHNSVSHGCACVKVSSKWGHRTIPGECEPL